MNHPAGIPSSLGLKPLGNNLWVKQGSDHINADFYEKLRGAHERCSGIEHALYMIRRLTSPLPDEPVSQYIERMEKSSHGLTEMKFTLMREIDWSYIREQVVSRKLSLDSVVQFVREAALTALAQHAEFSDVFTPHLTRVPRDVDGKLLPNKDAGCSPPSFVLDPVSNSKLVISDSATDEAVAALSDRGVVVVRDSIPLGSIDEVRNQLRIQSSFSAGNKGKKFDTRETRPEEMFEGDRAEDVSFTQLASGRYMYHMRCSKLESVVKPLHTSVMPIVWDYLAKQRKDTLLNRLISEDVPSSRSDLPRVFLSEVALVCSDSLASKDSWHATNGGSGVVVMVPLSPFEKKIGNTVVLQGSHKAWTGVSGILKSMDTVLRTGGVTEIDADCGDAVVMDARLMRMTNKNEMFNRSRVWLAFHYDFTDKPAPYQWLPRTLFMNALAVTMVHMDNLYRKLPPLSRPNELE